jgi:hypothetical protein
MNLKFFRQDNKKEFNFLFLSKEHYTHILEKYLLVSTKTKYLVILLKFEMKNNA